MTRLSVPDMSCGHCKASVEAAVARLDPQARVQVDLAAKTVDVESTASDDSVIAALGEIGFPARPAGL